MSTVIFATKERQRGNERGRIGLSLHTALFICLFACLFVVHPINLRFFFWTLSPCAPANIGKRQENTLIDGQLLCTAHYFLLFPSTVPWSGPIDKVPRRYQNALNVFIIIFYLGQMVRKRWIAPKGEKRRTMLVWGEIVLHTKSNLWSSHVFDKDYRWHSTIFFSCHAHLQTKCW